MGTVLTPEEISELVAESFFATPGTWIDDRRLGGKLDNGKWGYVTTINRNGMFWVHFAVLGGAKLGFVFQVLADEATDLRISRYLDYFYDLHQQKSAEWEDRRLF